MLKLFFVALLFVAILCDEECLIYEPEGKGKIDLTTLKGHIWNFNLTGHEGHTGTATIGTIGEECVNPTVTAGPTPIKDEYTSSDGSCWYVGGLEGCTFDQWDDEQKTSIIYYPGVEDPEGWTRNAKITVHCTEDEESIFECNDVEEGEKAVTFLCSLKTKYGCPNQPEPHCSTGCSGHGKCIGEEICQCDEGYEGTGTPDCKKKEPVCPTKCSGHGVCIADNTCKCDPGFEGTDDCKKIEPTCETGCSGHGVCIADNTCKCDPGYEGTNDCKEIPKNSFNWGTFFVVSILIIFMLVVIAVIAVGGVVAFIYFKKKRAADNTQETYGTLE